MHHFIIMYFVEVDVMNSTVHTLVYMQVSLLQNPGCPGSPITGDQSDLEVARCAALGLWSCSRSKSNKIVRME